MIRRVLPLGLLLLAASLAHAEKPLLPYQNPNLPVEARVNDLLSRMTLEEKLNQVRSDNNDSVWRTAATTTGFGEVYDILRPLQPREAAKLANEVQRLARQSRLGIPLIIRDEALHGLAGEGPTSFPQSMALAATWDPAIVGQVADCIGHEARVRGVRRVLSPVINVVRDARWGRVEETYGEDPVLQSRIAVAYVKALEDRGVATTPKHFVANVGDGGRDSHSIYITEQQLREVYLPPFEAVVRQAGARSIMTAYNSLNGVACSANHWLLTDLLKREWGFRGVVGSDYGAASGTRDAHHNADTPADTAAADMNGGLDIEWPNIYIWGQGLEEAVHDGRIPMKRLDDAVRRMLRNKLELGLFDQEPLDPAEAERVVQCDEHRAVALQAGREGLVLLRNRAGTLPLSKGLRSLAYIGTAGWTSMPLGGYSGSNIPTVSLGGALREKLGTGVDLKWAPGGGAHPGFSVAPIPAAAYTGLRGEYYTNRDLSGQPALVRDDASIDFDWSSGTPAPEIAHNNFSVRWTGTLTPAETGRCTFSLQSDDGVRLFVDGSPLIDNWTVHAPTTDRAQVSVKAGVPLDIRLEYYQAEGQAVARLGWGVAETSADPAVAEAARVAASCDAAIVTVTIDEGEGRDRSSLDLPGNQAATIKAVADTGTPTVVVVIAGAPVTMGDWLDSADAILMAWYPGQEGGSALAEALLGELNPGGKLPMTFPRNVGQCPVYYNLEPSGRGYDYVDSTGQPQFAFGFGLSYTTFAYSDLKISPQKPRQGQTVTVSFQVENTGVVAGDEVPQLYIRDVVASLVRPLKQLKDFTRLPLAPGEKKTVTFSLTPDQLAFWNAQMKHVVEPGRFDVMVGSSSSDIRLTGSFEVK
jgi:beta-glucosidase